jgi:hypothetical protein
VFTAPLKGRRNLDYFGKLASNEALAGSPKKILGIGTRLLHGPRIVALFELHFMKDQFHSNLRCVSSLYEHPRTVCEGGVSGPLCCLFLFWSSRFPIALVLARLRFGGVLVSPYLWVISYFESDVLPLAGAQSGELKTVLCPYASGDLRGNAVPLWRSQRHL